MSRETPGEKKDESGTERRSEGAVGGMMDFLSRQMSAVERLGDSLTRSQKFTIVLAMVVHNPTVVLSIVLFSFGTSIKVVGAIYLPSLLIIIATLPQALTRDPGWIAPDRAEGLRELNLRAGLSIKMLRRIFGLDRRLGGQVRRNLLRHLRRCKGSIRAMKKLLESDPET